jgi:hypothetical protein
MLRVRLTVTALSLLFYACSGGASSGPLDSSGSGGGGGTSAGNAGAGGMSTAGAGGGGSGEGGASGAAGGTGVAGQAGGPDGGQQDGSPSDGIGSASFAAVQSIFATTCVRCHIGQARRSIKELPLCEDHAGYALLRRAHAPPGHDPHAAAAGRQDRRHRKLDPWRRQALTAFPMPTATMPAATNRSKHLPSSLTTRKRGGG